MEKIIREATQILQRISNAKRVEREWQKLYREEQDDKNKPEMLAEIFAKDELATLKI